MADRFYAAAEYKEQYGKLAETETVAPFPESYPLSSAE